MTEEEEYKFVLDLLRRNITVKSHYYNNSYTCFAGGYESAADLIIKHFRGSVKRELRMDEGWAG